MKKVITASCLLLSLVILFVIVACKNFYSGDDAVVQQEIMTEKKSITETTLKPVEKPTDVKLTGTKPVAETKPVETKPVTDSNAGAVVHCARRARRRARRIRGRRDAHRGGASAGDRARGGAYSHSIVATGAWNEPARVT